jgi:protein tyrosine/serine phosphatase
MKKKPSSSIIYIILIITLAIFLIRHFHIKDFCVMEPDILYTSGQPRGMDYTRLLYKYHISTIVNIRPALEHMEKNWHNEEVIWTKNNAVLYLEIPIEKNNYFPDEQTQNKFIAIMADKHNLPVLLHGSDDDKRVAMLAAVWLRKYQQLSAQETIIQVKKIIDDRPLTEQEIAFINNLK